MLAEKKCSKCKEVKPRESFSKDSRRKDGMQTYCKDCNKAYKNENREQVNKTIKEWYQNGGWEHNLKKQYGVPIGWYPKKYTEQDGQCAICSKSLDKLVVDHNHVTGQVRDLLCQECNRSLGHVERPEWLAKALAYLDKHEREQKNGA